MSQLPSYVRGDTEPPLLEETIGTRLQRTVQQFGEREALIVRHQGYRATYRELFDEVTRAALGLMALGVERGDRVAVWAPNRYEWVILQFATARVGAILVNVNPGHKAQELEFTLRQSGARALFLARGFRQSDFVAMLREVMANCRALKVAMVLEEDWSRFLQTGRCISRNALEARESSLAPADPINIQYTSGTTGMPKGATLTHRNILNNGYFVGQRLGYRETDRVCIPVPFYHCFGMVMGNLACISHGASMVIPSEAFDPLAVLDTIQEEACTALYGVPTMFFSVLAHPRFAEYRLTSLRTGVMAGAPCPPELLNQLRQRMSMEGFAICYGMTETSPVSTQTSPDDPLERRIDTVGRVLPHLEVRIIDPRTGKVLPRGMAGELCTRGYSVMQGYWDDPEATARVLDREGWMHSGDLAALDEEGYVRIEGRLKDMIIRGGENITPLEVENYLLRHPGVAEVQVVGVPSEKYGEELMAWVKTKPGCRLCAEELDNFCRGSIATVKIPRYWKFVDEFPLTATGKVKKFRLREMGARDKS